MTKYNSLNKNLSNSKLNKLRSRLRLSSNMVDNSNNQINFPHKLL